MEAEHCLEWEFSGILHSAKNIIAIYRCCFSDQTTSIATIIYEDVTGSWKIITSKNKFETSVGLTHWDLAPYLHASFPLQDSFAKCSPSWYDVHSMKASSANGDAWFAKLWDEYILQILKWWTRRQVIDPVHQRYTEWRVPEIPKHSWISRI